MDTDKGVCVFVIIRNMGKILLVWNKQELKSRQDGSTFVKPAGWGRPGGGVDPGEDEEDAAVREASEETGLLISVIKDTRYSVDRGTHFDVTYIGEIIGGKKNNACEWFPEGKLPGKTYGSHAAIIRNFPHR